MSKDADMKKPTRAPDATREPGVPIITTSNSGGDIGSAPSFYHDLKFPASVFDLPFLYSIEKRGVLISGLRLSARRRVDIRGI